MYYLAYYLIYFFSLTPLWLLYLLSDLLYIVIYRMWGYRVQVVTHQLQNCFPEKSDEEINSIIKQYYKNLCDQIVETIKLASMSEKQFLKRFDMDWETWLPYILEKDSIQFWTAHFFNFEWMNHGFQLKLKHYKEDPNHKPYYYYAVYSTLGSKFSDWLFLKLRSVKGSKMISTKDFIQGLKDNIPMNCMGLIADQSPSNLKNAYWLDFFGQVTAFFSLPEKLAVERNSTVIFPQISKVKRGYYKGEIFMLTETPRDFERGELTKLYVERLETEIRRYTPLWMWSHRRWKRVYSEEYAANRID